MEIERRQKTVLDESRLLILGAQVLFGFQFEAVFQELFAENPGLQHPSSFPGDRRCSASG
jgi:hypothetical protein